MRGTARLRTEARGSLIAEAAAIRVGPGGLHLTWWSSDRRNDNGQLHGRLDEELSATARARRRDLFRRDRLLGMEIERGHYDHRRAFVAVCSTAPRDRSNSSKDCGRTRSWFAARVRAHAPGCGSRASICQGRDSEERRTRAGVAWGEGSCAACMRRIAGDDVAVC